MLNNLDKNNSRVSKFFRDFGIYSIGVIGTRIITFMLVPLYTYFIERPADYGYYDICLTLCMLLIPVSTLQLRDGTFRFLYSTEDENERIAIITFVYKTLLRSLIAVIAIAIILVCFFTIPYLWYTIALLLAMTIQEVVCQTIRGLHNNRLYVSSNLVNVFCIGFLSLFFVAFIRMGVEGIFIANILSRVISILYIEIRMHTISKYFNYAHDTSIISSEMMRYVLPLIPISVCWYLTIFSDRLFVNNFLGLEVGGIYAVAVRFTSILQTLSLIFCQTWQETSISQYGSKDFSSFFSKVFNLYVYVLVALLILYTFILKLNYSWLIESKYSYSIVYLYPLGIAATFNALASSYFDMLYQCAKETKRAASAVFISLGINLICNYFLIGILGVWGVILTSTITYGFLMIYRVFDTKRYFTLSVSPSLIVPVLLVAVCAVPFYLNQYIVIDILVVIVALAIMLWSMPNEYTHYMSQIILRKFKKGRV